MKERIVPAILVNTREEYIKQMKTALTFAKRVQIDISDGIFTEKATVKLEELPNPGGIEIDLHMMVQKPSEYLEIIKNFNPTMCIFHAEARENLLPAFEKLREAGIKPGLALYKTTFPGDVKEYIAASDHVLIFAGELGEQGSEADMIQVEKEALIREINGTIEIGWDGGARLENVRALAHAGIDVINVGSAIFRAEDPAGAYKLLSEEAEEMGVRL